MSNDMRSTTQNSNSLVILIQEVAVHSTPSPNLINLHAKKLCKQDI